MIVSLDDKIFYGLSVIKMEDAHLAQGLNYLVAYKMDKGLLINFGGVSLEVKRLLHPKKRQS